MEEWLFDRDHNSPVGHIRTMSGVVVVANIGQSLATDIVAVHNAEWKRSLEGLEAEQYWLAMHNLGDGVREVHALLIGDRGMAEQQVKHWTDGLTTKFTLNPIRPRRVSIAGLEELQRLFKEMRQHETDAQKHTGLANSARAALKALGAPVS